MKKLTQVDKITNCKGYLEIETGEEKMKCWQKQVTNCVNARSYVTSWNNNLSLMT